jgi:hypothetical protein
VRELVDKNMLDAQLLEGNRLAEDQTISEP